MMDSYRLHYAPDNASLVIRLALEEMGQPYQTALVDRRAAAHKSAAYRALNPAGLIPVLETPDGAIFETAAILLWLADRHPEAGLMPRPDSPRRAHALKWLFHLSNTVHADLRILFYPDKYIGSDPAHQTALQDGICARLKVHLENIDRECTANPDLLWRDAEDGLTPTAPLLYLACMMRWMALYPGTWDRSWFDITATPALAAALAQLEQRPSTATAAQAEGLGPTPFTQPSYANPSEGSAT